MMFPRLKLKFLTFVILTLVKNKALLLLILAGESVFLLPFVLPRIFRPTVLQVFEMNDTQLGKCFSVYGIVALISYLLGGPIADRFPPRKLMAISLWLTAIGGFVIAGYPSHRTIEYVYAYWGFTTIFLFWAAMLKATRQWGGDSLQGRAFGFLDGGRGLVSAVIGTICLVVYGFAASGTEVEEAAKSLVDERSSFRPVILTTTGLVIASGVLVWLFLKNLDTNTGGDVEASKKKITAADLQAALSIRSVWLLMIIVLCGYVGYKATDDISTYAVDVMGYSKLQASTISNALLYTRPVIGVLVGVMADRTRPSTWIVWGFLFALLGSLIVGLGFSEPTFIGYVAFYGALIVVSMGVYAIRSLYFAALQEGQIPLAITGTAIGLISVIGYTPDIFMGPVMGYFLDGSPGELGHQHLFWFLFVFAAVGLAATSLLRRGNSRADGPQPRA